MTLQTFTHVKRGYNPEEVDAYIATLEQVIKSYKDKDNAIKNAIISAQVAADNVVRNAHLQANDYKAKIVKQLSLVQDSIDRQRAKLRNFQDDYEKLVRKYLQEFNESDIAVTYSRIDELEQLISSLNEMEELAAETTNLD